MAQNKSIAIVLLRCLVVLSLQLFCRTNDKVHHAKHFFDSITAVSPATATIHDRVDFPSNAEPAFLAATFVQKNLRPRSNQHQQRNTIKHFDNYSKDKDFFPPQVGPSDGISSRLSEKDSKYNTEFKPSGEIRSDISALDSSHVRLLRDYTRENDGNDDWIDWDWDNYKDFWEEWYNGPLENFLDFLEQFFNFEGRRPSTSTTTKAPPNVKPTTTTETASTESTTTSASTDTTTDVEGDMREEKLNEPLLVWIGLGLSIFLVVSLTYCCWATCCGGCNCFCLRCLKKDQSALGDSSKSDSIKSSNATASQVHEPIMISSQAQPSVNITKQVFVPHSYPAALFPEICIPEKILDESKGVIQDKKEDTYLFLPTAPPINPHFQPSIE